MQATDLLEIIGDAEDRFILEADADAIQKRQLRKRKALVTAGSILLALSVCAAVILGIIQYNSHEGASSGHRVGGYTETEHDRPDDPGSDKENAAVPAEEDSGDETGECEHTYELEAFHAGNCSEQGWEQYTCTICGDTYRVSTGYGSHNFVTEYSADGHYTCCTVCGESYFEQHVFTDGSCSCGYTPGSTWTD